MTDIDPMLGPCAHCGHLQVAHPGGYCPTSIDASGMVDPNAPIFEPISEDESDA